MAMRPGEENVAILFGDVHYFYGPETAFPPHHRFSKGSYVYLFEDAQEGRARIEIANHVGTEHQDAFDGFLDHTAVTYSHKHSCMVSFRVLASLPSQDEWHLPTYDPSNQHIYHYPLHAIDIYFWTPADALKFVDCVRRVLPVNQVDIRDEPAVPAPPPLRPQQNHIVFASDSTIQPISTAWASNDLGSADGGVPQVVQKLEAVSINGQPGEGEITPRWNRAVSAAESLSASPPTPVMTVRAAGQTKAQQVPGTQAPFAYNPAAPAAPETIRLREKTPPPENIPDRHPLHQTLYDDAATPFSPGLVVPVGLGPLSPGILAPVMHVPPGAPSFPAPPVYGNMSLPLAAAQHPGQLSPMQQHTAQHPRRMDSITMPVASLTPFNPAASFPAFSPPPTAAMSPPPPLATNGTATPLLFKPPLEAGYGGYSYGAQVVGPSNTHDYSIHQQLYRPAHGEVAPHTPKKEPRGLLEESAGRLEKGVTGMLKKFEKRFG
ncbi:hypothetical protein SEPCBS119000_005915 [Sporothrix epigloea]|uniref:RNA recognition motif-containing protein n=1 Tax=Sporothrix epigloea TaxID=1892477 RepID=A0ABP0E4B3_9PEZI